VKLQRDPIYRARLETRTKECRYTASGRFEYWKRRDCKDVYVRPDRLVNYAWRL